MDRHWQDRLQGIEDRLAALENPPSRSSSLKALNRKFVRRNLRSLKERDGAVWHMSEGEDVIFDVPHYRSQVAYSLDASDTQSLYEDFSRRGFMHGYAPSPLFDTRFVQHHSPVIEPTDTFVLRLWIESEAIYGPDPHPLFDSSWYRARQRIGFANPLAFYLKTGVCRGDEVSDVHLKSYLSRLRVRRVPPERMVHESTETGTFHCTLRWSGDSRALPTPVDSFSPNGFELVTFDLWDTLVVRSRHPEAGKLRTALRLKKEFPSCGHSTAEIYDLRVDIEASLASSVPSGEYKLRQVLTLLAEDLTQRDSAEISEPRIAEFVAQLAKEEVRSEALAARPRVELVELLRRAIAGAGRVALLSDHYFSGDDLRGVLEAVGLDDAEVQVFSSSDIDASKRLGTAFSAVRDWAGVSSDVNKSLHVGDTYESDVVKALESGFESLHVPRDPTSDLSETLSGLYDPRDGLHRFPLRDGALRLRNETQRLSELASLERRSDAYADGVSHSILPLAVVLSAIDTARRVGVDAVHYLGREGQFLANIHSRISECPQAAGVRPITVNVSRRSVFPAALATDEALALDRAASQYRTQTVRAFLTMVGVGDLTETESLATSCDLTLDEVIEDTRTDARLAELVSSPRFRAITTKHSGEQKALLSHYLEQRHLHTDGSVPAVVCDIGWRGTVQDLLSIAFPDLRTYGVYLGLFPLLTSSPAHATKIGVAFDGNVGDRYSYVDPPAAIEGPWTVLRPSPIRYESDPLGVIRAGSRPLDRHHTDSLVRDYQSGVLDSAEHLARLMDHLGLDPADLKWFLADELEHFFTNPAPTVSNIWFEQEWDESFGSGLDLPYRKDRPNATHLRPFVNLAETDEAKASRWVPGWLHWSPVMKVAVLKDLLADDH